MANLKDLIVNGVTRFIGKVYAPTPVIGSKDSQVATTSFVQQEITSAISGFVDKNSITNCILEAPNGVMVLASDNINFTLKQGLKVLVPNGRNADGTLKNTETTLTSDAVYTGLTSVSNLTYYAFVDAQGDAHVTSVYQSGMYEDIDDSIVANQATLYFAIDKNKTYLRTQSATSWTEVSWAFVGTITKTSAGSTVHPEQPICLIKQSDRPLLIEWGMPDYSAGVDYANDTTVKTAPSNGVLVISYHVYNTTTGYFKINGETIAASYHNNVFITSVTGQYMLSKGDTFQITSVGYNNSPVSIPFICRFYPCKGAN